MIVKRKMDGPHWGVFLYRQHTGLKMAVAIVKNLVILIQPLKHVNVSIKGEGRGYTLSLERKAPWKVVFLLGKSVHTVEP